MFPTQSYGTTSIDPNTRHAIEQIASVINDVEQRLQLAKLTLAQTVNSTLSPFNTMGVPGVPQLPTLGFPNVGFPSGYPTAFASPWATPYGVPYYGAPLGFPTASNPGVIAPFGITPGMAPTLPFRF
jgi:hypothetical protein